MHGSRHLSIQVIRQRRLFLLWVGLFLAIALDTSIQLCWKASVPQHGSLVHVLFQTLIAPLFIFSMLLHIWQLFNWMMVLSLGELSFVQPITALSYVAVVIFSRWFFLESVHPMQIMGIALVLVGVVLVSRTAGRDNSATAAQGPSNSAEAPS
jgi:drug/metabolite transporter (DMT)-like permease